MQRLVIQGYEDWLRHKVDQRFNMQRLVVQGYEDWLRHKADREVNNRKSTVVEGGRLKDCKSMDIKVMVL